MSLPPPEYGHLLGLIDDTGIYEHSRYGVPRREHGYTLDDASRALIVLCDAPVDDAVISAIRTLLAFTLDSMTGEGRFRNRLTFDRQWLEEPETGDTQGRAIWALSVASVRAPRDELRQAASSALSEIPDPDSPHLRPLAYSSLGAQALWEHNPLDGRAARFAAPFAERMRGARRPWPETRLTYANGRIPAAMLAGGQVLGDGDLIDTGLLTLSWLVEVETRGDHLSFAPVDGWAPDEPRPGFDQQPVEAAALSDACERAWVITGEDRWKNAVVRCGEWLQGRNDGNARMYDPVTGATSDGLMETGTNSNSGAESTIAGLAVLQACARVASRASASSNWMQAVGTWRSPTERSAEQRQIRDSASPQ
jgi:hypothetical protein